MMCLVHSTDSPGITAFFGGVNPCAECGITCALLRVTALFVFLALSGSLFSSPLRRDLRAVPCRGVSAIRDSNVSAKTEAGYQITALVNIKAPDRHTAMRNYGV
jgi:hypothetical protein